MTRMLTFPHADLTRDAFLASTKAHRTADRIAHSGYWDNKTQSGCAIGCSIQTINHLTGSKHAHSDHDAVAAALGLPVQLAQLEDAIFEGLPHAASLDWPVRFAEAIPERADLSGVWPKFAAWMLRDICLPALGKDDEVQAIAIRRVAAGVDTGWTQDDRAAAGDAARAAARAAAWAAARAAARAAAWAAARDAAWAAARAAAGDAARAAAWAADRDADRAAAGDAARAAAWAADRDAAYIKMADKLCALLTDAPVVSVP